MTSGPEPETSPPATPQPKLPGEFVSEDMRVDCARFLHDVRRRTALRRETRSGHRLQPGAGAPAVTPEALPSPRAGAPAKSCDDT